MFIFEVNKIIRFCLNEGGMKREGNKVKNIRKIGCLKM